MNNKLSISGRIAAQFQNSKITPLLAIMGMLMGLFALAITPQEEEPQISVTFANVFIPFPGASAKEVEQIVAIPAEQKLSEVDGLKHIYSISKPGMAVVTVQFKVGEDRNAAILRLYNAVFSNADFLPQNLGVGQPLVKPMGIDDVPIVTFTLWSNNPEMGAYELSQVAHSLEVELKRVTGTRDIFTVGGSKRVVHVKLDPHKVAGYGLFVEQIAQSLQAFNTVKHAGHVVDNNQSISVQVGKFLTSVEDVASLSIGIYNGVPVYLRDVAKVSLGPEQPKQYVWIGTGAGATQQLQDQPAVTIAVAKKSGVNAASIAESVIGRMERMRGFVIPDDVNFTVTRNYGATAAAKATKLIGKLAFATAFVVLLVLVTMGWREAIIVGVAVVLTLALTLFANWAWGFTLNRVSLFALIFSIGILVDDAIVVVENIHRHMHGSTKSLLDIIPKAVDEVGSPTILATFTVISALLPMAFVSGLMGPYMGPIPINASIGMLISLIVAFVVTPWLSVKGLNSLHEQNIKELNLNPQAKNETDHSQAASPGLSRLFTILYNPFTVHRFSGLNRLFLALGSVILIAGSLYLVYDRQVVLKMLPFDNKSEFQVVVDLPENSTVEETAKVMSALGGYIATIPEVTNYQVYAGTSSPVGFNGLVRQYYLRSESHMGDIQVNLTPKKDRDRKSHEIALAARGPLQDIGRRLNANVKIVEVPPGPPVQSPLVLEVYGPKMSGQKELAATLEKVFVDTADIVDVDTTVEADVERYIFQVDQKRASTYGVSQLSIAELLQTVLSGRDISFLRIDKTKYTIPIHIELSPANKADMEALLGLKVKSTSGELFALSEFITIIKAPIENAIYHKDLVRVVYVTADMAGDLDSPLYGMKEIYNKIENVKTKSGEPLKQHLFTQPEEQFDYSVKWDGEWQITFETFRDMGIAYGVGLLMIYLLVVAQFGSYSVPLIIMAPIPLTVIGVMPGHAIMGAQFTATSMIGMIALAGIIVRNSILLVDFINETIANGEEPQKAIIMAGAIRTKPIVLTGLAAMLGALFIIDDPIFGGLAICLVFGIFVSTLLTLWIIPILYYPLVKKNVLP
ncbi:MAG: efflux RND transporter permease subunit [Magnetococcales bacterium]|nr:efflux RND transporter permease subunit [Magnetococcales bacterium]